MQISKQTLQVTIRHELLSRAKSQNRDGLELNSGFKYSTLKLWANWDLKLELSPSLVQRKYSNLNMVMVILGVELICGKWNNIRKILAILGTILKKSSVLRMFFFAGVEIKMHNISELSFHACV